MAQNDRTKFAKDPHDHSNNGNGGLINFPLRSYSLARIGNEPVMFETGWSHRDCSRIIYLNSKFWCFTSRSPDAQLWANTADATISAWSADNIEGPWTLIHNDILAASGIQGAFDRYAVYNPCVFISDGYIYMAYNGSDTPPDGSLPAWQTATSYVARDFVSEGGTSYLCLSAHTSGTFADDLVAGKWEVQQGNQGLLWSSGGIGLARVATSGFNGTQSFTRLDPLITSGGESAWDWKVDGPDEPIKYDNNTWRIYYKGVTHIADHATLGTVRVGFIEAAASASFPTSPASWTRYSGNPVYGSGVNGSYNSRTEDPHVIVMDGVHYICSSNFDTGGDATTELFLWYKSANGIDGWVRAHEIEGFMDGALLSYLDDCLGYVPVIWNQDLSYMIFQGIAKGGSDYGQYLYKYVRSGNPPALLNSIQAHVGDSAVHQHMADVFDGDVLVTGDGTKGHVPLGTTALCIPYLDSKGRMHLQCIDNTIARGLLFDQINDGIQAALLKGRKSRGTVAAPTATQSGDNIVNFSGDAYDGAAFKPTGTMRLETLAAPNPDNTWGPNSKWVFHVVDNADADVTGALEIRHDSVYVPNPVDCEEVICMATIDLTAGGTATEGRVHYIDNSGVTLPLAAAGNYRKFITLYNHSTNTSTVTSTSSQSIHGAGRAPATTVIVQPHSSMVLQVTLYASGYYWTVISESKLSYSGTYTPTATSVANLDATPTPDPCQQLSISSSVKFITNALFDFSPSLQIRGCAATPAIHQPPPPVARL